MIRKGTLRSTLRVIPAFAIFAVVGCLLGHFLFRVPLVHLGLVVAVPTCIFFFITRLAVVFIPRTETPQPARPPLANLLCIVFACVCFIAALVMFPSAFVYRSLGFVQLFTPVLHLAEWCIALALLGILLTISLTLSREFQKSVWVAFSGEQRIFWQMARIPTLLAVFMTRTVSDHTFHLHR